MLATQVEYWKLQETGRHNLVTEQQGWRNLDIQEFVAKETQRHNLATEGLEAEKVEQGWAGLAETSRHNLAVEGETARHNVQTEGIGWGNLDLSYAQLHETSRHNQAMEGIGWGQLGVDARRTEIQGAQQLAQADYWNRSAANAEQRTSNDFTLGWRNSSINVSNAEANRMNAETNRVNAQTQQDRLKHDIQYDWSSLRERTLHDLSSEARQWMGTIPGASTKGGKSNGKKK